MIEPASDIGLSTSVRDFRPGCPGCTPDNITAEGARPCSFYDCPGLPDELRVTCDECMFDFAADDGQITCDHHSCPTALRLQNNVDTYRSWVRLIQEQDPSLTIVQRSGPHPRYRGE